MYRYISIPSKQIGNVNNSERVSAFSTTILNIPIITAPMIDSKHFSALSFSKRIFLEIASYQSSVNDDCSALWHRFAYHTKPTRILILRNFE
ncbi:hypothetical protein CDAR_59931 [Caerostris darwini]|uniref:Uncharacterized protein n=1 Tax=Caerostris darwini TaxID=1538125 RepID=A0AAV4RMU8_9ARAC|nr:hypothetical protein CDAR_59931 [Caerostris darwini]